MTGARAQRLTLAACWPPMAVPALPHRKIRVAAYAARAYHWVMC